MILLQQMLALFLMMLIGYFCGKKDILDAAATKKISWLVVNVANVAMILQSGLSGDNNVSMADVAAVFGIAALMYIVLLEMLILSIVDRDDSYGYQISQKIKPVSGLKDSALYPVLKRLSENGCIESYDKPYQGRNRKYYRMTENGRNYYHMLDEEWDLYLDAIWQIRKGADNDE